MRRSLFYVYLILISELLYGKIIDLETSREVAIEDMAVAGDIFVLGESHYNPKIQNAQARIMAAVSEVRGQDSFDFAWEFLNTDQKTLVAEAYQSFLRGKLSSSEFLTKFLGENPDNESYAVLLELAKSTNSSLIATNLSRAIKRQVSQGGIEALDPRYLPNDFQIGSTDYYERFVDAMGGHGGSQVERYFAAQSLVDNVMAESLLSERSHNISFLACGSFHSDYLDGVVFELMRRSTEKIVSVRFIDREQVSEDDIHKILYSEDYGPIADYAYILP